MRGIGTLLLLVAALAVGVRAGHATSATAAVDGANVRGQLLKGPLRPVAHVGEPNQAPASGVGLAFYRGGSLVTSLVTGKAGRFSLKLKPGVYAIRMVKASRFSRLSPVTFRVAEGRRVVLALNLDTGIRAPIQAQGTSS
ncbi:MAG: hypothetical protein WCJ67_08610 [Thermoleophilia bacterium]